MRLALLAVATLVPLTATGADLPPFSELPSQPELPNPLVMLDGTQVSTAEMWTSQRRPELKRLFQHYVYGYLPEAGSIEAKVTKVVPDLLDGKATLKEVEVRFPWLKCDKPPVMHLAIFLPNDRKDKAPVFLALNRRGNHAMLPDGRITPSPNPADETMPDSRGAAIDFWCTDYLIERGYGFATFHESEIDPDKHDFTDGLHACLDYEGVPEESRPGTIAAWAWGLHRAVDYLVTDPDIDAKRICVTGHSRRGKTALVAGAMDERIALVVPHQSGTGGMALSRGNDQETVERITRVFPHWFCDRFDAFGGHEDRLPVDQHCLVALVAPRPLLDTAGLQDTWANYDSALRTLKAAHPVYELLGTPGLVGEGVLTADDEMTRENVGTLQQYRLDTKHEFNRGYWKGILDFADVQLGGR
ncbi:MAG: acetylxylan esterase [Planctomycetota bacterium]|nr:acetylxylan esterase [Planctomycetaceae bacterium]MDQ3329493.1 acetylxylan esterase [Planctomycetota bacterium]